MYIWKCIDICSVRNVTKCNENDRRRKKKLHDEQGGALESSKKTIPARVPSTGGKARISRYVALYTEETEERGDGCGAYRRSQKYDERTMCSRDNCRENCVMPLFTLGKLTIYDSAITPLIGSSTVFFDRSFLPVIRSRNFFPFCNVILPPRERSTFSSYEQLYI